MDVAEMIYLYSARKCHCGRKETLLESKETDSMLPKYYNGQYYCSVACFSKK